MDAAKVYVGLIVLVVLGTVGAWIHGNRGHPDTLGATFVEATPMLAPVISWQSSRPHADRGLCTRCHEVVTPMGTPIGGIFSDSMRPHEYRGACRNCHQVQIRGFATR